MKKQTLLVASVGLTLLCVASAYAFNPFSKDAGEAYRSLPQVKKGGTLFVSIISNPNSLNPLTNLDMDTENLLDNVFIRLMQPDYETGQYYPMLAEKLDVSRDHKVLTYTLRKDAVWEDGTPITTEDVEFTFQKIMDPKVDTAQKRVYFDTYQFQKIDTWTFKFTIPKPNVNSIQQTNDGFRIIQKKQFEGVADFNHARAIMEPISSGPYRVKSFQRDQKVELERKKDWWGYQVAGLKNQFNFDSIVYRILPDASLSYEKFVKGEIDVFEMNSELYGTRVKGSDKEKFGTDSKTDKPLWAAHFKTQSPAIWTYIGWNLKRPLFQSKKTRQALAQLINYDELIDKAYHGEAIRCFSPFGSNTPNTAPDEKAKAFKFNPSRAIALLKEDGWSDADQDGTLSKLIDGKKTKFEFTIRYNSENPMRSKIAQIVKEQFKKAGITMNIQALEYNTLLNDMQNRDFDAIIMGWGKGNFYPDSKQVWHTSSWANKGSNAVGYSNPEVDKLIDQATDEVDVAKHFKLNQKIGAMIYDDQPYAFLLEVPGFMVGFQSHKVNAKKWVMKYDDTAPVWMYSGQ